MNCSSKLQLLFCGGEFVESRGGGELASLFDDDPGGVNEDEVDNPLAERFCGASPPRPDPDSCCSCCCCDAADKGKDAFDGV